MGLKFERCCIKMVLFSNPSIDAIALNHQHIPHRKHQHTQTHRRIHIKNATGIFAKLPPFNQRMLIQYQQPNNHQSSLKNNPEPSTYINPTSSPSIRTCAANDKLSATLTPNTVGTEKNHLQNISVLILLKI